MPGAGPIPELSGARADPSTRGADFLAGLEEPVGGWDGLTGRGAPGGDEENDRRGDDSVDGHGLGDRE